MPLHKLTLPDLGIRSPIRVGLWLVDAGESVAEDQPIVEIVAGEAVVDLPSVAAGRLTQIVAAEDEQIEVGQVLAVIESDDLCDA